MFQYLSVSLILASAMAAAYFIVKKLFYSNLSSLPPQNKMKPEIDVIQKPDDKESPNG